MPYNDLSVSLEDNSVGSPIMNGSSANNVVLSDLYNLDFRTIWNKSISTFLVQYAMFYFDIDAMVFSPADTDLMLALKNTAIHQVTETLGSAVRRQFPQLVM